MQIELARLSISRQEEFTHLFIQELVNSFRELNYSFNDVIQRIKLCKIKKRFGNRTTLQDFTEMEMNEYAKYYKEDYGTVKYRCLKCGAEGKPIKEFPDFDFSDFTHNENDCGGICRWEREMKI